MRPVNRCIPVAGALRSRTARGLAAAGLALAALTATASPSQALVGGQYTGFLSVSATTVKVGTTFTATQQAISLGDTQTPGITVGSPPGIHRRCIPAAPDRHLPDRGIGHLQFPAAGSARDPGLHPDPCPDDRRDLPADRMDHPADRWRQRGHRPDRHDHCHPLTWRGAPGWTVVQPGGRHRPGTAGPVRTFIRSAGTRPGGRSVPFRG